MKILRAGYHEILMDSHPNSKVFTTRIGKIETGELSTASLNALAQERVGYFLKGYIRVAISPYLV